MNSASCLLQETNHPLLQAHNLTKTEFNKPALIKEEHVYTIGSLFHSAVQFNA